MIHFRPAQDRNAERFGSKRQREQLEQPEQRRERERERVRVREQEWRQEQQKQQKLGQEGAVRHASPRGMVGLLIACVLASSR